MRFELYFRSKSLIYCNSSESKQFSVKGVNFEISFSEQLIINVLHNAILVQQL